MPVVVLLESPEDPLITKIPPLTPEVVPSVELLDQPEDPLVPSVVVVPVVALFDQLEPLDTLAFVPFVTEELVPSVVVTDEELFTPLLKDEPSVKLWLPDTPLVVELPTDSEVDWVCD